MSTFDIEKFHNNPQWDELDKLRKADLLEIANHYKVVVDAKLSKKDVLSSLTKGLIENEIVEEITVTVGSDDGGAVAPNGEATSVAGDSAANSDSVDTNGTGGSTSNAGLSEAVRLKELDLEKQRLELEFRREEMQMQLQMKRMELEAQAAATRPASAHPAAASLSVSSGFDASRNVRLVPPFDESDVDRYFAHFEKVAVSLKWPKQYWSLLLQSVLKGRAQEVYSALSVEQCSDFDVVKKNIELFKLSIIF